MLIEYINNLKKLNPSKEELITLGHSEAIAEIFHVSFSLELLDSNKGNIEATVKNIVNYCKTSQFVVFTFRFLPQIKQVLQYSIFGENEADSIAIDNNTGEIVQILYTNIGDYELGYIEEMENITHVAINEEGFLKALQIAVEMSSKSVKKELTFEKKDFSIRKTFANRCITEAGGKKYEDFWNQFMDCLE